MPTFLRAASAALAMTLLLAGSSLAKGEEATVTIGPIDDMHAGTPAQVTAQVAVAGRPTDGEVGAYLSFYEPVSKDQLEFALNYDDTLGAYVTMVTLPHEGRWLIDAGTRYGTGADVPYGTSDGTHVVTVGPAIAPAPEPLPFGPALFGAAAASAAWLLSIGAYALRRRRLGVAIPSVSERLPA